MEPATSDRKSIQNKLRKGLWYEVGRAIKAYRMIEDGDRVGVGLSGGKDSSLLLFVLASLMHRAPVKFEVVGLHVDPGFGMDTEPLKRHCATLGVEFHKTDAPIRQAVFEGESSVNPCALCANLRRGALNTLAKGLGLTKIALAHHADDALETLIMSMMYEGRIYSFQPSTYLDRREITVVRPMVLVTEDIVKQAVSYYSLPVVKNPCPVDKTTKREEAKRIISLMVSGNPQVKRNLLACLRNVDLAPYILEPPTNPDQGLSSVGPASDRATSPQGRPSGQLTPPS